VGEIMNIEIPLEILIGVGALLLMLAGLGLYVFINLMLEPYRIKRMEAMRGQEYNEQTYNIN